MLAIYEPYVLHTSVTFEYTLPTEEEFAARMAQGAGKFPWLVCEKNGKVVGYAYAAPAFSRTAYSWDADVSVYLSEEVHRCGIGSVFYLLLERLLKELGYQVIYALVTQENFISAAFHEARGYRVAAVLPATGFKFGRWHDILWYEKRLCSPTPPRDFPGVLHTKLINQVIQETMDQTVLEMIDAEYTAQSES